MFPIDFLTTSNISAARLRCYNDNYVDNNNDNNYSDVDDGINDNHDNSNNGNDDNDMESISLLERQVSILP